MSRFNKVFTAVMMSTAMMFATLSMAQAQGQAIKHNQGSVQGKLVKPLTLQQKADILNKMAIHNVRIGKPRKAAHFFLKSFYASRVAKDRKRASRAIANLKRLKRDFGKTALSARPMNKPRILPKAVAPTKPYNMPDWKVSKEA